MQLPDGHHQNGAVRLAAALAALTLLAAACSGESGPTTTRFIPPSSEVIFELTTTTSRPPSPLDPVFIEDLGVTVDIPRDWEYRTEALRFGRASAAFRADDGTGALLVIGLGSEIVPDTYDPVGAAGAVTTAVQLANLLDITPIIAEIDPGTFGDQVDTIELTIMNGRPTYRVETSVTQIDGSLARVVALIVDDGAGDTTVVALLYDDALPADRLAQGTEALASIRFE